MEIDLKRNDNKFVEYISTETSTKYDVNKLDNIKNIDTVYLMNNKNLTLTKKSEMELKHYFTKNKNELIKILHEAISINKEDYKNDNLKIINDVINSKFNSEVQFENVIRFKGIVDSLPENSNDGEIYGLNELNKINYYLYLNGEFFAIMGKTEFENQYYKKEDLNLKLNDMNSKLIEMISSLDEMTENLISKDDLNFYISKINELNEKLENKLKN